ncbi:MAG: polysaccharide biosynthesis tyrosine autokinase [Chloroflexaceae bacterium]|nr:polysaccharide biosynthesis tyrosine autokinase [Chloroflexaceae bacterium]
MDIKHYLEILWRRKWFIIITPILAVMIAAAGTMRQTPTYVATATLRLMTAPVYGYVEHGSILYAERLLNTYAIIVKTNPIVEQMRQQLEVDESTGSLASRISVSFPGNSELMQINFEDENPAFAADAANVLANIMIDEAKTTTIGRNYPLSMVDPAGPPTYPTKPRTQFNIAMGFVVGLMAGLALALMVEVLDTSLHTTARIAQATRLSTLGRIPAVGKKKLGVALNGDTPPLLSEAFRHLRTSIFAISQDTSLRTLVVTSAEAKEGKSTIVANLATAIAHSGRNVVVVDSNLRQPAIHTLFGVNNTTGLSTLLRGQASIDDVLQVSQIDAIHVIASGPIPDNPADLLSGDAMTTLIDALSERFDMVLLDSPAMLEFADASILALATRHVVLVVERSQARQEVLEAAFRQFSEIKIEPVGVVVNRAEQNGRNLITDLSMSLPK